MSNMVGGGVGPNGPYGGGVGVGGGNVSNYGGPGGPQGGINVNANNPQQQILAQQMAVQHGGVPPNMTAAMQQGNRGPGGVPMGMGGGSVATDGNGAGLISGPQQQMNNAQINSNQQQNPQGGLMGSGGMGIRPAQGGVCPGGPQQNVMMRPQQQQQQQGPGTSQQGSNPGGSAAGSSGTGGTGNQHITDERKKQIQQQLMLLLHARKCNRRDSINPNREKCNVPYCKPMQEVLTHMATCKQSRDCPQQHCISSREILLHYKICSRSDCVICYPFRKSHAYQNNNPHASGGENAGPNNANQQQQQQQGQQNVNDKQGPGVIGTQHVGVPQQTGTGGVQNVVTGASEARVFLRKVGGKRDQVKCPLCCRKREYEVRSWYCTQFLSWKYITSSKAARPSRHGFSLADLKQGNPQEARKQSIQRCIQSLVHACQCRDANCRLPSCQKIKRVVQHTKNCKRKTNGWCPICKQLIVLSSNHAKHCQEQKCPVTFCPNIKQQQLQQKLQQQQLLRRRVAFMSRTVTEPASSSSS